MPFMFNFSNFFCLVAKLVSPKFIFSSYFPLFVYFQSAFAIHTLNENNPGLGHWLLLLINVVIAGYNKSGSIPLT